MKIITILLLMISTQILAEERVIVEKTRGETYTGPPIHTATNKIKQCNQIANISKRTIKAAISGVPIAEVIDRFTRHGTKTNNIRALRIEEEDPGAHRVAVGVAGSSELDTPMPEGTPVGSYAIMDTVPTYEPAWPEQLANNIRLTYKTVNQIKTKHGQVRPQDRVLLNNRVELKLIECVQTGTFGWQ